MWRSIFVYLSMETLKIEIIDPKVKKLLKGLAELQLISIKKDVREDPFQRVFREVNKRKESPSMEDITKEVEAVRAQMYAAEKK